MTCPVGVSVLAFFVLWRRKILRTPSVGSGVMLMLSGMVSLIASDGRTVLPRPAETSVTAAP